MLSFMCKGYLLSEFLFGAHLSLLTASLSASTDQMRPTHTREGNLLGSHLNINIT